MELTNELNRLFESGMIAIIRRPPENEIKAIVEALVEGGVTALEFTADTPHIYRILYEMKAQYGDHILVGTGTVLDTGTAVQAIKSGADFILSPHTDQDIIQSVKQHGKISIPGAMTPTEILKAYEAGADLIKVFPSGSLGTEYIKALQGPLGHIPLLPTGGVSLENVESWFKVGARAVGVGGSLVNQRIIASQAYQELKEKAAVFLKRIAHARQEDFS